MRQKIVSIARTSLLVLGLAALSGCYADHYRYGYSDPAYGYSPYSYSTLPPAYAYAPPAYAYGAPAYRYRYDDEHHPVWHRDDDEHHLSSHREARVTHPRTWVHHDDDDE